TEQHCEPQDRRPDQSASRKIQSVLSEKLRDEVRHLPDSILLISRRSTEDITETEMVRQLRRAIIERATVRFCYHTRYVRNGQSTQQTREADPYGLVHYPNAWHLVAYGHLRHTI